MDTGCGQGTTHARITRVQVVAKAREYVGTPYHHQGRVKGHGVDCIGLIFCIFGELGIDGFDKQEYRNCRRSPPRGEGMLRDFDVVCGTRLCDVEPGDLAVFWINTTSRRPQHVALVTDYGLLHTYSDVGRVVEHLFAPEWRERFICGYHVPGVM